MTVEGSKASEINRALDNSSTGKPLTPQQLKARNKFEQTLEILEQKIIKPSKKSQPIKPVLEKFDLQNLSQSTLKSMHFRQEIPSVTYRKELSRRANAFSAHAAETQPSMETTTSRSNSPIEKKVQKAIQSVSYAELDSMLTRGEIDQNRYDVEIKRRDKTKAQFSVTNPPTGIPVEYRNWSHDEAKDFILNNVPQKQQQGLLKELEDFDNRGANYSVTVGRDGRGYRLVRFQTPSPWVNMKKESSQSVTREIRKEVGKGGNRLINPDYSHNEIIAQYKLVRAALPDDSGVKQALEKTDSVISAVLTSTGLAAEATNLLVNAIRGALLESPELKYKVAALIPDDLVRQTYVAAARTGGNTIREFIHKKYHLPDRPKKTPVMVNTLDQIKPEHYRAQDAQKVGITMRDLNRENAIKFIHDNVPVEKQESAIETINRLPGNQFGVSIMDSGWVRIDASAREPRKYEDRPHYDNRQKWVGSYNATDDTKMP